VLTDKKFFVVHAAIFGALGAEKTQGKSEYQRTKNGFGTNKIKLS
jgi:hypothetical protein